MLYIYHLANNTSIIQTLIRVWKS